MSLSGISVAEADFLRFEQDVLSKIKQYLEKEFEDRHQKAGDVENSCTTSTRKAISANENDMKLRDKFWPFVKDSFSSYFEGVDNFYDGIFIHPKKRRVRYSKTKSGETKEEIYFTTCIETLKKAFIEVDNTYLKYSRHREECNVLYSKLIAEIDAAIFETPKGTPHVLGTARLDYLDEMLDLQDEDVVRLLPFLLTAYIYNFRKNVFIQRKSPAADEYASIYDAEKQDEKRIRKNLDSLSTHFGFANKDVKFPSTEANRAEIAKSTELTEKAKAAGLEKYPVAFLPNKFPSLNDRPILDLVFAVWCTIVCGIGEYEQAIPSCISQAIDIELCYKLYILYGQRSF